LIKTEIMEHENYGRPLTQGTAPKLTHWDKKYLELARHISLWSKDTNAKVGAIIVNDKNRVVSMGYNGLPAGCNDNLPERNTTPEKYLYFEHAERNAIYSAAAHGIPLAGCTIYITRYPCADCARAIIQTGIKKVVCEEPDFNHHYWGQHFKAAHALLSEVSSEIVYHKP
jgi:dCMP deaminase